MNLLFLSRWFPYPADNGSKLRIYRLLRSLAQFHKVSLISFCEPGEAEVGLATLNQLCRSVQVVPVKPFPSDSTGFPLSFLSQTPRFVLETYSEDMETCIRNTIQNESIHAVIASQFDMAIYRNAFKELPALFEEAEIGVYYDRYHDASSVRKRLRNWLTWTKHRRYLGKLIDSYQACTVVSGDERQLITDGAMFHTALHVIPNSVDLEDYQTTRDDPEPGSLIYTGSFTYEPNYDAMVWFIRDIFPIILDRYPSAQLTITGNSAGKKLPDCPNVTHAGYVDDIRPYVARTWVSLAPLREGGGSRLKILEAMAIGTPVVATQKGAQGLDVEDRLNICIADTTEEFAGAVLALLNSADLRRNITQNAYQLVERRYNWKVVFPNFLNILDEVVQTGVH